MAKEMGEWSAGKSRMLGTYRSNKLWTGEQFFSFGAMSYWMRKTKLHRLVNSKNSHPWSFEKIRLILKFLWPQPQGFLFAMSVWRVPHRLLQVTDSIIDPVLPSEMHTWTPLTFWSRATGKTKQLETTVYCYCEEEQVRYYCHGTDLWLDLNCLGYLGISEFQTTVEKYLNARYLCSAHRAKAGTTRITWILSEHHIPKQTANQNSVACPS